MNRRRHLRSVPAAPQPEQRADLHDHEWKHRQKLNSIDWAKVHVDGDKRSRIVEFASRTIHRIIGSGTRTERGGFLREERP